MNAVLITQEHHTLLKQEVDQLRAMARDVGQEMGDAARQGETTHDNAPFDVAQQEFEVRTERVRALEEMFASATITVPDPKPNGPVVFGSTVEVMGVEPFILPVWYLVTSGWFPQQHPVPTGEDQSDPVFISYKSPLAQLIMGKRPGDEFEMEQDGRSVTWCIQETL